MGEGHSREYVAYFTMETGISHRIPTYSGGLGILAGDLLKSYADLHYPIIAVTMLNEKGYFKQVIDSNGMQTEEPVNWNPGGLMVLLPNIVTVTIEGRNVKVRAWKLLVRGCTGYSLPLIYLDTNVEGNSDYDKTLTSYLYGGDKRYRLSQEIVLGIGGVRMLESLGYSVRKYHMNEGHSALLTIELIHSTNGLGSDIDESLLDEIRDKCIFTTHTPVAAGHDVFEINLFKQVLGDYVPESIMRHAIHEGLFNMTFLALSMSNYVNGVAKKHGEVSREMFPEYRIDFITNGIHHSTWVSPPFRKLFDTYFPGWLADPFNLRYAVALPKGDVWDAHMQAKQQLIDYVNAKTGIGFHAARFTIGCARRFTEYKRNNLILYDKERLKEVANTVGDIQIIFAGKAHTRDTKGKEMIKKVIDIAREINSENGRVKIVFLDNYDMELAKFMTSGCDIWLNTPQRPYEASGTSGMKAALNGVPHLSTLDGWWLEGCVEGITGWAIGPHPQDPDFRMDTDGSDEAIDLYLKLEKTIIPMYYGNRDRWIEIMRQCIAMNGSFFNSYRMAQQYIVNAYRD